MSNEQKVLLERHDDVAVITLNVPARHNAIDLEMVQILHRMLDDLAAADEVAALVVTGAGEKAFAAGADIAQLKERKAREALAAINSALFKKVEDLPLPVIAAVSFELQRFSARYCTTGPLQVVLWPGFLFQKISTREPESLRMNSSSSGTSRQLSGTITPPILAAPK